MQKFQIEYCEKMIKEWISETDANKKNDVQKKLFIFMKPFMEKWISAILCNNGRFLTPGEITSYGWDSFQYCLIHFKPSRNIPVPNHFYAYTKFCLMSTVGQEKKEKKRASSDYEKEINTIDIEEPFLVYEHIQELKVFRSRLSQDHASIFDDAIMSMVPNAYHGLRRLPDKPGKSKYHNYAKYHEAKNIFKIVIEFLLTK